MRKVQWKRKKKKKETDFINKNQKLSVLKSVLKLWFSKNMKLGLEQVFTELVACKVHHTYHDGSKRSCTLVCVFQTRSCKIVIDHRQKEFLPNNKRKESTALLPRLIFKTVWTKLQLIYWYTWGHFFCFGCSNANKKKTLHVPANACSPCKKIYKIALSFLQLSLTSKWVPFFILIFS